MREGNRHHPTARWTLALAAGLGSLWLAAPAAAVPINDNYLSSLRLNDPGKPLNRTDTLVDRPDTTGATVQTDVFNPPMMGGPAEPTTCQGVNYGSTLWYDIHPDINGAVRIRTSGYDTVISLIPFSDKTLLPDFAARRCVPNLSTMTQELDAPVLAKQAYTIQVGGVAGAAGKLEFLFDFIPTIGKITADAQMVAQALPTGVRVQSLTVTASGARGTRVDVRCTRGCRPQAKAAKTVSFPGLKGTRLAAGQKLQVYVTAPNAVGAYFEYRIKRRGFQKIVRCLSPGSRTPKVTC
jgi:hypothetical protein